MESSKSPSVVESTVPDLLETPPNSPVEPVVQFAGFVDHDPTVAVSRDDLTNSEDVIDLTKPDDSGVRGSVPEQDRGDVPRVSTPPIANVRPPPTTDVSLECTEAPDRATFLTFEEARTIQSHYEHFKDYSCVVRMKLVVFYPLYTSPIIPMCRVCVHQYCINYSHFNVIDYLFPNDVDKSFRDEFYCFVCNMALFSLTSVPI